MPFKTLNPDMIDSSKLKSYSVLAEELARRDDAMSKVLAIDLVSDKDFEKGDILRFRVINLIRRNYGNGETVLKLHHDVESGAFRDLFNSGKKSSAFLKAKIAKEFPI